MFADCKSVNNEMAENVSSCIVMVIVVVVVWVPSQEQICALRSLLVTVRSYSAEELLLCNL